MKSFGETLTLGADYCSAWPRQPELMSLFPEQRIIYLLSWAKKSNSSTRGDQRLRTIAMGTSC